jgi:P-type Ca2+ transporter type 2C
MNEQTVTEIYVVDEVIKVEATVSLASRLSPAARKVIEVGALCNNATLNEQRVYVGQATDVALCNVLSVYDIPDPRSVRAL